MSRVFFIFYHFSSFFDSFYSFSSVSLEKKIDKKLINSGLFGNNQKWWMSRVFFIFLSIFYRFSSFFDSFYSFSSVSLENDKKLIKNWLKNAKFWAASETIKNGECLEFFSIFYHFSSFFDSFYSFSSVSLENDKKNDKKSIANW